MFGARIIPCCVGMLGFILSNSASGQASFTGKPLASTDGYAARELRIIQRTSVGTGYSGADVNRLTANSLRERVPSVGQVSTSPRIGLGAGGSSNRSKPFSTFSPSPTVSPYLNLFRDDFEGNDDFNYQTLVRPQLEQQRVNEQLQRQNYEIGRQLQAMSAAPDFNPQGNQNLMPTGHQTVFGYHSHFYPQAGGGRQRR